MPSSAQWWPTHRAKAREARQALRQPHPERADNRPTWQEIASRLDREQKLR